MTHLESRPITDVACWIDRLGDRLDHPERVAPEFQHLIPDDQQRVKRLLEIPVKGRVLEVGCGDGAMTRRIHQQWPTITLEVCDVALRPEIPSEISGFDWDIREVSYLRYYFDALYCCEVLEHLTFEDVEKAMTHMMAVLRPGGTFICSVPNQRPALRYVAGCRDRWKWPDHRSCWLQQTLTDLLERHGITERRWYPLYPDVETSLESIWLIVSGIKR